MKLLNFGSSIAAPVPGTGATNKNAAQGSTVSLDINVGDTVVIFCNTNAPSSTTVSDDGSGGSNTYNIVAQNTTGWYGYSWLFIATAVHAATTVTVAGGSTCFCVGGSTWKNVSAIGATAVTPSGTINSPVTQSLTTTQNNSEVLAGAFGAFWTTFTATSGTALATSLGGGDLVTMAILGQTKSTIGSATSSGTFTTSGAGNWEMISVELMGVSAISNAILGGGS